MATLRWNDPALEELYRDYENLLLNLNQLKATPDRADAGIVSDIESAIKHLTAELAQKIASLKPKK